MVVGCWGARALGLGAGRRLHLHLKGGSGRKALVSGTRVLASKLEAEEGSVCG